ncbi:MAG: UDP-N-acetylmuramoyl-tripeptide--D-alanyl-D-alanine ligase [Alphaproteobacteria bacterium]
MTAQPLWTAAEAALATGGQAQGTWRVHGVSIDSRSTAPGDLFVAVIGERNDGHRFINAAFERGAAAAMVSRVPENLRPDAPLLVVADTRKGLVDLACAARTRTRARVAAVTGSVGKTGTKEGLFLALSALAPTHASQGNLNNDWGAPLSIARLPAETAFAVFELGMNHAGEIAALTRLVRPDVAVITAVTAAHTEFFSSLDAIADAKAEVFLSEPPPGTAILNRDSAYFERLAGAAKRAGIGRILGFGAHTAADVRLIDHRPDETGATVETLVLGHSMTYRLGARPRHWAINSTAILAAVHALGADVERAAAALADWQEVEGRGRRFRVTVGDGSFLVIDESYNASPAAMEAAIAELGATQPGPGGRRIAVLGDMLELGAIAEECHARLAGPLLAASVDRVLTAGPLMARLRDSLPERLRGLHGPNGEALALLIVSGVRANDVVLVKGSHSLKMHAVVDALRRADSAADEAGRGGIRHAL